jgi:hypothetical protein
MGQPARAALLAPERAYSPGPRPARSRPRTEARGQRSLDADALERLTVRALDHHDATATISRGRGPRRDHAYREEEPGQGHHRHDRPEQFHASGRKLLADRQPADPRAGTKRRDAGLTDASRGSWLSHGYGASADDTTSYETTPIRSRPACRRPRKWSRHPARCHRAPRQTSCPPDDRRR